jgi:hypothetical protein
MPKGYGFQTVPVDDVTLDLGNPRIAQCIEMYGGNISAEQMSLALHTGDTQGSSDGTTFVSLRESIRTNGGVIHPILVNQLPDGRRVVIEGNTRTLIYREFREQGVPGEWSTIPAIVYEDLSAAEVDSIRLQAHLVGPREWDPYSKARYLNHLRKQTYLTFEQIVQFCGGQKRQVVNYIDAYNDMERYYRPALETDSEFDPSRFSAFVELQRQRVLKAILDAGFTKADFALWVRDGLLSPLQTVRQLPLILSDDEARGIFLEEGAREAIRLLDSKLPGPDLVNVTLAELAREVSKRVLSMSYGELQRLRTQGATEEADAIQDARDQLAQLCQDFSPDD